MVDETSSHIRLEDFVRYTYPRPKIFLLYSICFEIVYWILLPALIFVSLWGWIERGIFIFFAVDFPLLFALVELSGRLRKRFRANPPEALKHSTKAPILYLRSFYYENVNKRLQELLEPSVSFYERENDDEVLASALKEIGPLVAVGKPRSNLPPLGSVRLYFKDEEWQEQVKKLMRVSQFVIIQPGHSEGTEWEIERAKELLSPDKVIYSFLSWYHLSARERHNEYEVFAMQIKRIYGCDLPNAIKDFYFLYFTKVGSENHEQWKPHLVGMEFWKEPFFWVCSRPNLIWRLLYRVRLPFPLDALPRLLRRLPTPRVFRRYSVPSVRESLRPLLNTRGIKLNRWRTAVFALLVLSAICVLTYVKVYFNSSVGEYEVKAYDEKGVLLFNGDMHITDSNFRGTAKLNLLRLKMASDCFSPQEVSSKTTSCEVYGHDKKGYYGNKYFEIGFTKNSLSPDRRALFYGTLSDGVVLRPGQWYFDNFACLESETTFPGQLSVRHKFPWE